MTTVERRDFRRLWSKPQWPDLPVHRSLLTPLAFLERTLHVFPDRPGVVDGDRRFTYAEFGARVYRLASALRRAGVGKGDRVALLCPNATEVLEAHFAVPQLGAVLVPLNVRLSAGEVGAILEHAGARALIASPELAHLVAPARAGLPGLELLVWCGGCRRGRGWPARGTRPSSPGATRSRSSTRWTTRTRRSASTTPAGRPAAPRG
jgi:fatty-acyl-CoA synthase